MEELELYTKEEVKIKLDAIESATICNSNIITNTLTTNDNFYNLEERFKKQEDDIIELKRLVLKLLQKDYPEEVLTVVEKWGEKYE